MSPTQDPGPTGTGRTLAAAALRLLLWIRDAAVAVMYAGLLIAVVNFPFPATESRQKVGFLGLASLACVVVAIPGALVALGHPWADNMLWTQRFNHPRLFGLAQLWAGILVSGWLSALVLLFPSPPVPLTYVVFLAGLGPMYAIMLFDRRR